MFSFLPSTRVVVFGLVGFCFAAFLSPLHAQQAAAPVSTPVAVEDPAAKPQEEELDFCTQLLTAHPNGGEGLEAEVQTLVAASPDVAKDIHGCACPAEDADVGTRPNGEQSKAIGSGLANALKKIENPDFVDEVKEMVAQSCSKELKTAFEKEAGDQTAAIDDGGAGDDPGAEPTAGLGGFGGPGVPVLIVTPPGGGGTGGGDVSPN